VNSDAKKISYHKNQNNIISFGVFWLSAGDKNDNSITLFTIIFTTSCDVYYNITKFGDDIIIYINYNNDYNYKNDL